MKYIKSVIAMLVLVGFAFAVLPAEETAATGKDIFLAKKCNACHAVKTLEIAGKPNYPDLSTFGAKEGLTKEFATKFLMKEEKQNDKLHPIKFKGSDEELGTLVDWLLTLK
jgi:cytochrome c551/c552